MNKTKPFSINKWKVLEAWRCVKENNGSAGIDEVSIETFEKDLKKNLYKIWNRLSSGTYFPPPVKRVEIPKSDGKMRPLGIPTVEDRVAQMVVKLEIESQWDSIFHPSSFGYRKGKSAHNAVAQARSNCFNYKWAIDLDIKGFFDNIDHGLMIKAIDKQNPPKWVRLALLRWLKADVMYPDGNIKSGERGTPQGGVISPLLANLFLHYVFDKWMQREYPNLPFERYADDAIIHCMSEKQAKFVLDKLKRRMSDCKLELHPEKTKIVNCDARINKHAINNKFDFLGFTFRRRGAKSSEGVMFTGFLPAVSDKAKKAIRLEIKSFNWRYLLQKGLDNVARVLNPYLNGIINYYGKFYPSELEEIWHVLEGRLAKWIMAKKKKYRGKKTKAFELLEMIKSNIRYKHLFAHWKYKSKMKALKAI